MPNDNNMTAILGVTKITPGGKVVFAELRDEDTFLSVSRISGLYLDPRDLASAGFSKDKPRLKVTIEAVA